MKYLQAVPIATLIASSASKVPITPGTILQIRVILYGMLFFYLPTPRTPLSTHFPTVEAGGGTG
jgi:hypothetical protein